MTENDNIVALMPEYKCHKKVRALKIKSVYPKMNHGRCIEVVLFFEEEGIAAMTLSGDYNRRFEPKAGGYFIKYEDGYESFSPAEAFESGYTLIGGEPSVVGGLEPNTPVYFEDFIPEDAVKVLGSKDYESIVEHVAAVAHEANRSYCEALGDESQVAWMDAPDWQRESAKNGVRFHVETVDAGPASSHESWLAKKAADGWKYGPVKDAEKREHPCFLPYDELPDDQKAKDSLFIAVVDLYRDQLTEAAYERDRAAKVDDESDAETEGMNTSD